MWRTRGNQRQGRDTARRLRHRGTRWLCRGLSTLWRDRVNRRRGRDMGGWLRLKGTPWLWLCKGLITLRWAHDKFHTPKWWLGRWLWLWLWTTIFGLEGGFRTHGWYEVLSTGAGAGTGTDCCGSRGTQWVEVWSLSARARTRTNRCGSEARSNESRSEGRERLGSVAYNAKVEAAKQKLHLGGCSGQEITVEYRKAWKSGMGA